MTQETPPSWGQDDDVPLTFRRSDLDRLRDQENSPGRISPGENQGATWMDRLVTLLPGMMDLARQALLAKNLMPKSDQSDQDQAPAYVGGSGIDLKPVFHPKDQDVESLERVSEPVGRSHSGGPGAAEPPGKSLCIDKVAPGTAKKVYNQVLDLVGSLDQDAKVSDLADMMILMEDEVIEMIGEALKDHAGN